jgi:hypothetical protein
MKDKCKYCGFELEFDQPYPIHAGFSNEGFMYSDDGKQTLVWSSFDPDYILIVGDKHPWTLNDNERNKFELSLCPSSLCSNWSFRNSIRCVHCHQPYSGPITETIYYYQYKQTIDTHTREHNPVKLKQLLKK